jgi:hypothetical protein
MDRAIVERAVDALAALNTNKRREAEAQPTTEPKRSVKLNPKSLQPENRTACGSPHCAGCYTVPGGTRIHPPKTGKDWVQ